MRTTGPHGSETSPLSDLLAELFAGTVRSSFAGRQALFP